MKQEISKPDLSCAKSQMRPTIGVVTVTFNSAPVLGPFLKCVLAQDLRNFILYVVDNVSNDESTAILKELSDPRLRLILNSTNKGVAEGNNIGIRAALDDGCETILLLNNDTEFSSTLFRTLYDGLAQCKTPMTTGKMLYFSSFRLWILSLD